MISIFKENEANFDYFLLCTLLMKLRVGLGCDESQNCVVCISPLVVVEYLDSFNFLKQIFSLCILVKIRPHERASCLR